MSLGKLQAVQPSFPCGQLPQVPLADMAQKDLPAFLSRTSFLIISATIPISTRVISIVARLSAKKSIILSLLNCSIVYEGYLAASTERIVSLVAS